MTEKTVVIVSPYFPPSTLAGVHRARLLTKHLPAAGWKPIVVCIDEEFYGEPLDFELEKLVPQYVERVKVRAVPLSLSRPLGFSEISIRAWPFLKKTLWDLLRSRDIKLVFITGSPFYPMLLGRQIKKRFGIPVLLDFQDPWVSAWGASQPSLSKAGVSHWLATLLEPRALRTADFITSVSDIQNAELAARYPWLDCSRMAAIPIGGDPDDFEGLRSNARQRITCGDLINFSYVGSYWPAVDGSIRALFRAYVRLRNETPSLASRIRLRFVGTSGTANDKSTYRIRPIAEAEGVAEAVHEIPQRVPYLEALNVLVRSDGVLMIGSYEPHYTASKIYPALMSGRPFLSLFHRASSAHQILSKAGGGLTFAFADQNELAALEQTLADGLRILASAPDTLGRADPAAYAPYEASAVAREYAKIFDRIVNESDQTR